MTPPIRLTQYSSGAGCGCKIAPNVLDEILAGTGTTAPPDARLLVGNELRDDAAAWLLDDGETLLLATTDFAIAPHITPERRLRCLSARPA